MSGRRRRVLSAYDGPHREGEEPKPMMHGHEKSDLAVVAMKPANNVAPRCDTVRGRVSRSGAGGAKGGDQGECGLAQHFCTRAPSATRLGLVASLARPGGNATGI